MKTIKNVLILLYQTVETFVGYAFTVAMFLDVLLMIFALHKGIMPLFYITLSFGMLGSYFVVLGKYSEIEYKTELEEKEKQLVKVRDQALDATQQLVDANKERKVIGGDHANKQRDQT